MDAVGVCPITQEDIKDIPPDKRFILERHVYNLDALRALVRASSVWPAVSPMTRQPLGDRVLRSLFGDDRALWPSQETSETNRRIDAVLECVANLVPRSDVELFDLLAVASMPNPSTVLEQLHHRTLDAFDATREDIDQAWLLWVIVHHPFLCGIFEPQCERCAALKHRIVKASVTTAAMIEVIASPSNELEMMDLRRISDAGRVPPDHERAFHTTALRFVDMELDFAESTRGGRLAWACYVALVHPFLCSEEAACDECGRLLVRVLGLAADPTNHESVRLWTASCASDESFVWRRLPSGQDIGVSVSDPRFDPA
jgi:hypothetical protein